MTAADIRDWFIMTALATVGVAIMTFMFKYPTPVNFATACGALVSQLGMFHWFTNNASHPT